MMTSVSSEHAPIEASGRAEMTLASRAERAPEGVRPFRGLIWAMCLAAAFYLAIGVVWWFVV